MGRGVESMRMQVGRGRKACRRPQDGACGRRHYQALAQQTGNRYAFGRERILNSVEELAEFGLSRAECYGARLLIEEDERRRAINAGVQQQLHHAKGDVDDGGVSAVQQRAAQPQRRVWPPRAA